jgi:hypothetical protein
MIKRLLLLAVLAAALRITGLLPFESSDVAKLKPVETLVVSVDGETVTVSGGDCVGMGETWEAALADLHLGAEGALFLGTAEQIVLCGEGRRLLEEIAAGNDLRPAAVVVWSEETIDGTEATKYLSAHDAGVTLRQIQAALQRGEGIELPLLEKTEGGLRLNVS